VIQAAQHEGQWEKVLDAYELSAVVAGSGGTEAHVRAGVAHSLRALGRPVLLESFLRSHQTPGRGSLPGELVELQREACWRNSLWRLQAGQPDSLSCFLVEHLGDALGDTHNSHLLRLFQAFRVGDREAFGTVLGQARCLLVHELAQSSTESVYAVQPLLAKFQCLSELENWMSLFAGPNWRGRDAASKAAAEQNLAELQRAWSQREPVADTNWQTQDAIMMLRCIQLKVLTCLEPPASDSPARRALGSHLCRFAQQARDSGHFQHALLATTVMKQMDPLRGELEEARTFWARGDAGMAIRKLTFKNKNQIIKKMKGDG
jgi:hypothetical protein